MRHPVRLFFLVSSFLFLVSCATYYQRQEAFNALLLKGDLEKADEQLAKDKKAPEGRNKMLYNLNRGTINWMLGKSALSNDFFNKADLIAEDYQKTAANTALTFITNPMAAEYKPEDFEVVLLHYYKAINWLNLGNYENALVECRRLNINLNALNDKYPTRKNRYKVDAFGLNLMGMVYDASGDYNNAFICYRNAIEAYENNYDTLFNLKAPLQLKKDLIRAAYRTGFKDDAQRYEQQYQLKNEAADPAKGELLFFWNNGLGPVKGENSINFTILPGQDGLVTFANEEYGINFPFYLPANEKNKQSSLADLKFMRVAFPKYIERPTYYRSASLESNGKTMVLEEAEDINQIAFKCLSDRMLRELGQSLLRLASKKAAEYAVRSQNQDLGALVGVVNAVTEKADTRNWQTLPYSISYTRMALPEGMQTVTLKAKAYDKRTQKEQNFQFAIQRGKTVFHAFQSLETLPITVY